MGRVPRHRDIITISHGLLATADHFKWRGKIQICDIDPGVRHVTEQLMDDYPDLSILSPGEDIRTTVQEYCVRYGVRNLGAVDVDLACKVRNTLPILQDVLDTLNQYRYQGKVFLTFRNGRDDFGRNASGDRIRWLSERLPRPFRYTQHTLYRSGHTGPRGERNYGSAMCIMEIRGRKV